MSKKESPSTRGIQEILDDLETQSDRGIGLTASRCQP
jgi:hypothetical protein